MSRAAPDRRDQEVLQRVKRLLDLLSQTLVELHEVGPLHLDRGGGGAWDE